MNETKEECAMREEKDREQRKKQSEEARMMLGPDVAIRQEMKRQARRMKRVELGPEFLTRFQLDLLNKEKVKLLQRFLQLETDRKDSISEPNPQNGEDDSVTLLSLDVESGQSFKTICRNCRKGLKERTDVSKPTVVTITIHANFK